MIGPDSHALLVLLVGAAVVAAALARAACARLGVPSLVGFIALGMAVRFVDDRLALMTAAGHQAFELLADIGIVALLFRVGLDSNLRALLNKLRRASAIWVGDVAVSGAIGFLAAYAIAGLGLVPSLVVATGLTATSVGVSTNVWQEAGRLTSSNGSLLVDVAELDDISAVLLMALVFAVVPALQDGSGLPWSLLAAITGTLVGKLLLFTAICAVVAALIEPRLNRLVTTRHAPSQQMLTVAGIGLVVAGLADWMGFSLAIGALFAGLALSRDPHAVRTDARFADLHALFVPFFFIRIGMDANPAALGLHTLGLGVLFLVAAALGKFLGAGLPAWLLAGPTGGLLIGLSMIPRAEIAMVVLHAGHELGPRVMPDGPFAAIVLVVLGTCLVTPWLLASRLRAGTAENGATS